MPSQLFFFFALRIVAIFKDDLDKIDTNENDLPPYYWHLILAKKISKLLLICFFYLIIKIKNQLRKVGFLYTNGNSIYFTSSIFCVAAIETMRSFNIELAAFGEFGSKTKLLLLLDPIA